MWAARRGSADRARGTVERFPRPAQRPWYALGVFAVFRAFVAFAVLIVSGCFGDDRPATLLTTVAITVEDADSSERLIVEVAAKVVERTQGLMLRQKLPEDAGMVFLFAGREQTGGFWMKDTYLPLSIAYIGADGRIVDIRDGKPLDLTVLTPSAPYERVLEVNQGWFQRHRLGIGSVVRFPAGLPAAE